MFASKIDKKNLIQNLRKKTVLPRQLEEWEIWQDDPTKNCPELPLARGKAREDRNVAGRLPQPKNDS